MKRSSNSGNNKQDNQDQNSNTPEQQLQEYRQKKHSQQQTELNKKRKEFIESFQRLDNEFKSLLIEISKLTDPNDLGVLLVNLDVNLKSIQDLLKTINDLEIDSDIKDLNACATKCQKAVTNTQMLNAEVFNEYTNQLTDALAKFETKVIQLCGSSNNNNNNETADSDVDKPNESPLPSTDITYVPRMESDDQSEQNVTQILQIETLPPENLLKIFGFLSPGELSKIAPTSKYFNLLANDLSLFQSIKKIRRDEFSVMRSTMLSKDGSLLICNTSACIYVFNIKKRTLIAGLSSNLNDLKTRYIYSVISDDGKYIASYCTKNKNILIQIWSIADKKLVNEFAPMSQINERIQEKHLNFSAIIFLSDQEIGILCQAFHFNTYKGTYFIKFDIKKDVLTECTTYNKFYSLQNLDQNLAARSCIFFKVFLGLEYGKHRSKVIFQSKDGTKSDEECIITDVHFLKDKKNILCIIQNRLFERNLVILDLNNRTVIKTLQVKANDVNSQISAVSLSRNGRYVAVCGANHILEAIVQTENYYIEIHDLTKDVDTCIKTLSVDDAQAVFFTEDELVVVGLRGIDFLNFKELDLEKNPQKVPDKSNSHTQNNNEKNYSEIELKINEDESNDEGLNSLPDEQLLQVLQFFKRQELASISAVNKRFNRLANDPVSLRKNFKIVMDSKDAICQSIAVSKDGNFVVYNLLHDKVYVWDVKKRKFTAILKESGTLYCYCTISADNRYIALYALKMGQMIFQVWDVNDKKIIDEIDCPEDIAPYSVISNITFADNNNLLVLFDTFEQSRRYIGAVLFTYDLTGTNDYQEEIEKWSTLPNISSNEEILLLKSSTIDKKDRLYSTLGRHRFVLNKDGQKILCKVRQVHLFNDRKRMLCILQIDSAEKIESMAAIIDLSSQEIIVEFEKDDEGQQISHISLSKDQRYVAVCGAVVSVENNTSNNLIKIYEIKNDAVKCIKILNLPGAEYVWFTADELLVAGNYKIELLEFAKLGIVINKGTVSTENSNQTILNTDVQQNAIDQKTAVNYLRSLAPDTLIAILRLVDRESLKKLKTTEKLLNEVIEVAFAVVKKRESLIKKKLYFDCSCISQDQSLIALANDSKILIFDVVNNCLIAELRNFVLPYHRIAISPDNKYVAALSDDDNLIITIWDIKNKNAIRIKDSQFKTELHEKDDFLERTSLVFSNTEVKVLYHCPHMDGPNIGTTLFKYNSFSITGAMLMTEQFINILAGASFSNNEVDILSDSVGKGLFCIEVQNPDPNTKLVHSFKICKVFADKKHIIYCENKDSFIVKLNCNGVLIYQFKSKNKVIDMCLSLDEQYLFTAEKGVNNYSINIYDLDPKSTHNCILTIPMEEKILKLMSNQQEELIVIHKTNIVKFTFTTTKNQLHQEKLPTPFICSPTPALPQGNAGKEEESDDDNAIGNTENNTFVQKPSLR